jgi:DNA mismatch repair protein MutL
MLPDAPSPWRIAGEVLDTYIVCEDAEHNVWLIDKHAAHERVNFDRLKARSAPVMSQTLLTPLVAQLGAAEYAAASERFALLRDFGFECEDFGGCAVLIRAIPADIDESEAASALEEIAGKLALGQDADPDAARDALLATLACKAAIKGGWKSDERELRALVDRVQSGEVEYCPHGRPVKVRLTQREIEKMFRRIV